MRIILAAIVGGIIMFCWGAFSHMVLPIGEMGIKSMPNEAPVMSAMKSGIQEPGLYFFPGLEGGHNASEAAQAAWLEKYKAGPHGILVYHPTGDEPMNMRYMGVELLSNTIAAFFVAFVLSMTAAGFVGRVIGSTLFGLVSWLSIEVSYWNWYGFPTDYLAAQAIDQVAGWFLAGIGIALFVKGRSK
jgi:hypothetical protein